ncbi:Calcium-binding EF-hand family protein [Perilla frutescens var. frutescens]|nr:Calcium-binding EF-hand family protein [Perilla frutescens var. frutescens]
MGKDLSDDQVSSMKEAFTLFDTDGDGKIAPSELGILMRSLGGNPTQAQLKSIIAEEKLSAPFDFQRFLDLMSKHLKPEPFDRQLRDAFKVLDKDATGYVVVSDLRHILTSIGEKLEPAEFDEWIREVDVGSDGKIKYEDFIARMVAKQAKCSAYCFVNDFLDPLTIKTGKIVKTTTLLANFSTLLVYFSPLGGFSSLHPIASHLTPLKTQENADSVFSFLKDNGFSNSQLEKIAKASPHLLSANLETNIKRKFTIFQDLGFTSDEIVEIVSRQSKVLHYSAPRISSSISALKSLLGSTAAAAKFLKSYGSFTSDMEMTLLPNVELLNSCGVPMEQIIRLICGCPRFFLHKPEDMRKFVGKADEMGSDRRSGSFIHAVRVVSSMTSETWRMKVKTLLEIGFSEDDVRRAFKNSPKVFSSSGEKMKRVAEVLLETGKYDTRCIACTPLVFQFSIERRIRPRMKVLRVLEEKDLIGDWPSLSTLLCVTNASFFEKFVAPLFG